MINNAELKIAESEAVRILEAASQRSRFHLTGMPFVLARLLFLLLISSLIVKTSTVIFDSVIECRMLLKLVDVYQVLQLLPLCVYVF